jgi:hypothetical protein
LRASTISGKLRKIKIDNDTDRLIRCKEGGARMPNQPSRKWEDTGGHVVPVEPTLTERQEEIVATAVQNVRERGKLLDQQFPDVLGNLGVKGAVAFEQ